jgi:hypothetical protein
MTTPARISHNVAHRIKKAINCTSRGAASWLSQCLYIWPMPQPLIVDEPAVVRSVTQPSYTFFPSEDTIDPGYTVAVFDGNLREGRCFCLWPGGIEPHAADNIGKRIPGHGNAITSAIYGSATLYPDINDAPYAPSNTVVLGSQTNDQPTA